MLRKRTHYLLAIEGLNDFPFMSHPQYKVAEHLLKRQKLKQGLELDCCSVPIFVQQWMALFCI